MPKRSRIFRQLVDLSSLRTRLTLGVALLATLGIGSMAAWMGWQTERILVGRHERQLTDVVAQIPQDIERYRTVLPLDEALQKVIDLRSFSDLSVVAAADGSITTQSMGAGQDAQIVERLVAQMDEDQLSTVSSQVVTDIVTIDGQDYLVGLGPLQVVQQEPWALYVFLDITEDTARLEALRNSLVLAATLTLLGLAVAVALYVKRALQPLRQMSQITAHLKLEELGHVRVQLENAPTEVSELVETCETMLARLARALDQQRQFTHDISHELRTPLTISYGYLQSLQRRGDNLSRPQKDAIKTAIAETEHSIAILEDLLNLARADSGTISFSLSDICVLELVHTVAQDMRKATRRSITLDTTDLDLDLTALSSRPQNCRPQEAGADTTGVRIKADPERLRQVLVKLLDNALRYSGPEQPITLRLARQTGSAIIQVCDRGIGIPPQDQQRIFDRCYRVDTARNRATGGSGLGLSLVKNLVEGMGGHIDVASELGQGSTFTVSLPLIEADETSHRSRRRRGKAGSLH